MFNISTLQNLTNLTPFSLLFLPFQVTLWVEKGDRVDPASLAVDGEHDFFRLCGYKYSGIPLDEV